MSRPRTFLSFRKLACCWLALPLLAPAATPIAHLRVGSSTLEVATVAGDFETPYDLAWGPDNHLWCTQLNGAVWRIDPVSGERHEVLRVAGVFHRKSHGLQAIAFHPHFARDPYVYLHYVYQVPTQAAEEIVRSRLVRTRWDGTQLGAPETLLDGIPGRSYHNGSRLIVGPDEKLYLSTGDAGDTAACQNPDVLSGKILRLNLDGSVPADNPLPGNPVWSLGHRNAQGLAFSPEGRLYASEHGPNNDDEVNLIAAGRNYGWPAIEGFIDKPAEKTSAAGRSFVEPLRAWTPTLGACGLAFYAHAAIPEWRNALLFVNLKGRALRVLDLNDSGDQVTRERIFLQEKLGRLRDVCVSPAGDVYLLTSNTDWHPRFQPFMYPALPRGPDRIVRLRRIEPSTTSTEIAASTVPVWTEDLEPLPMLVEDYALPPTPEGLKAGQELYMAHCAACHRPDGAGITGLIPPLTDPDWVVKNKNRLIQVTLGGLSGRIMVHGEPYEQEMPAFKNLTDDELAALLTYVRASFGNQGNAVIPGEVEEERKGLPLR